MDGVYLLRYILGKIAEAGSFIALTVKKRKDCSMTDIQYDRSYITWDEVLPEAYAAVGVLIAPSGNICGVL